MCQLLFIGQWLFISPARIPLGYLRLSAALPPDSFFPYSTIVLFLSIRWKKDAKEKPP